MGEMNSYTILVKKTRREKAIEKT